MAIVSIFPQNNFYKYIQQKYHNLNEIKYYELSLDYPGGKKTNI